MKIKQAYICALLPCVMLAGACTDNLMTGIYTGDGVQITIDLSVPGESSNATRALRSRAGGTNQYDNLLDHDTGFQRYIADGDVYVLVFENAGTSDAPVWNLTAVPSVSNVSGSNGDESRTVTAVMSKFTESGTVIVDVVANLVENGYSSSASAARETLAGMVGDRREDVYARLGSFSHPAVDDTNPYGIWPLNETSGRCLPMWGQSSNTSTGALESYDVSSSTTVLNAHCGLYRSVSKLGVTVDSGCSTFTLSEIYVYYINNEGTFVSVPAENSNWNPSVNVQYTLPAVPATTAREITQPLVFKTGTPLGAGGQYIDNIYVTEADNINSSEPVCIVVGGYYSGGDYGGEGLVDSDSDGYALNYYRMDLTDRATGAAFDLIRNHSYIFNILNANNPGTSDPDPRNAAVGLEVEVLDYTDVSMHGINSQYALTVNQSLFAFEGATTSVGELIVNTDGTGWELVTDWTGLDGFPQGDVTALPEWVTLTESASGHTNVNDTVYIYPAANVNNSNLRNGSFWIRCGKILKKINIVQDYTETGNSYIITEPGTYDIMVTIRGNGNTTAWTNDEGTTTEAIDFGLGATIDNVVYAAIIWETADGFVTIPDPYAIGSSGCLSYEVNNVRLDQFGDWTGNVFDAGNGANALIGVYDSGGNLLWSYHIWALGDYADGELTETWIVGNGGNASYRFMDRNLGAYSNLPGSKSFGLLYQWGRKDPFIGAYREPDATGYAERDYHRVRKQYTVHYAQPNDRIYVWSESDDTGWSESVDIEYTIANPTTLLYDGLLSADHTTNEAHGLWGTTTYNYDNSELGNKTMYDPCPAGYRVPSLNALTIWDGYNNLWNSGTHSSFSSRYVPVVEGDDFRTGNGYPASFVSDAPFYGFWLDYDNQFGLNSGGGAGYLPSDAYNTVYYSASSIANGTYGYLEGYPNQSPDHVTWIPLAGIYNGSMAHFGRAGITDRGPGGSQPYLPASSLQVTSVLWANSPTQNNTNYPGGLLIHGTEGAYAPHYNGTSPFYYSPGEYETASSVTSNTVATEGEGYWHTGSNAYSTSPAGWWTGSVDAGLSSMDGSIQYGMWNATSAYSSVFSSYDSWYDEDGFDESGRHFHSYMETNASVYANPSYAGSVRCIRDKDAIIHLDDQIIDADGNVYGDETLELHYLVSASDNEPDCIELAISYIEEWEVVTPGAKWVSVSPSSGITDNPSGSTDTITITYNEAYLPADADTSQPTATIVIKFARGTTASINIQYVGGYRE